MVNVVKANIAGEPLQHSRQAVIRTAFEGGANEIPIVVRLPVCVLELMLNKKQPATNRRTKYHDREMNQEKRREPNREPCHSEHCQNSEVCQMYAVAFTTPDERDIVRKALAENKQ